MESFAMGERKGLLDARRFVRQELNNPLSSRDKAALLTIIGRINHRLDEIDQETK
jgi:hypothetical protein